MKPQLHTLSRSVLWMAASVLMCSACADPASKPVTSQTSAPGGAVSVGELLSNTALRGRTVVVQGQFAGWTGRCVGGAPRSRSDWMLTDGGTHCIYVSGPLPAGITPPPDTSSDGKSLSLRGLVEVSEAGQPYLKLQTP